MILALPEPACNPEGHRAALREEPARESGEENCGAEAFGASGYVCRHGGFLKPRAQT